MKIFINILKYLFLFILFFLLLYFESVYIAGIKFSIIWKIPVMLFFIIYIYLYYQKINKIYLDKGIFYGYLLSIKQLLNVGIFIYPLSSFILAFQFILLPLLWHFLLILNKRKYYKKIISFLYIVSLYILLSTIPFLLDLLDPVTKGVDLTLQGSETAGFTGLFQRPHSASIALASALLVIFYFQLYEKPKNTILYLMVWGIVIVGMYALLNTFVRTGWAMLIVGILVVLMSGANLQRIILKVTPFIVIAAIGLSYLVSTNEVIQNRLFDTRVKNEKNLTLEERIGSGRIVIGKAALTGWLSSGMQAFVIGDGQELSLEKMKKKLGHKLFSHNGFIDVLVTNGIVGITILILMLIYIYRYIQKYKKSNFWKLSKGFFAMFLVYFALQGGINYMFIILFAIILSILQYEYYLEKEDNEYD